MITNIQSRENLKEVAELKKNMMLSKTIPASLLKEAKEHGWAEEKKLGRSAGRPSKRTSTRDASLAVIKPKPHSIQIADRIWSLLYNMGFSSMSSGEPFQLQGTSIHFRQKLDIDIVSIDSEVGLGVFLQTSPEPRESDMCLLEDLPLYKRAEHDFKQVLNQFKPPHQSHSLSHTFILFHCGVTLDNEAQKLAKNNQVVIFNEQDLEYYEDQVERLGTAARYQFLAEVFENREIPSLKIEVPAIQLRAGSKYTYYVFAIRPDLLMKISFIAHHKPGKPADLNTYQRMANKERLEEMREYVREAGIYPTNIVVSLNTKPDFKRFPGQQKTQSQGTYHGELGTLVLSNSYKSAWIIDGQHRLFSYTDEKRASTTSVIVIAFVGLSTRQQTEFFFDINSKQAHIDELHLTELQRQIYQDAPNPAERLLSLIPQAIALLEKQPVSPFYERIRFPNQSSTKKRSISSATLNELLRDDLFTTLEYGVFYVKNDDNATIERITFLLNDWFTTLKQNVKSWWEGGNNKGAGGLAIDNSVQVFLLVLREVLTYLVHTRYHSLSALSTQEVAELLRPYASRISAYLSTFSEIQRQEHRKNCGTKRGRMQQVHTFLEKLRQEDLLPT